MLEILEDRENNRRLLNFTVIGYDGFVSNSGHNDVISFIKKEISRFLQWLIFLLYRNDLPLRHFLLCS